MTRRPNRNEGEQPPENELEQPVVRVEDVRHPGLFSPVVRGVRSVGQRLYRIIRRIQREFTWPRIWRSLVVAGSAVVLILLVLFAGRLLQIIPNIPLVVPAITVPVTQLPVVIQQTIVVTAPPAPPQVITELVPVVTQQEIPVVQRETVVVTQRVIVTATPLPKPRVSTILLYEENFDEGIPAGVLNTNGTWSRSSNYYRGSGFALIGEDWRDYALDIDVYIERASNRTGEFDASITVREQRSSRIGYDLRFYTEGKIDLARDYQRTIETIQRPIETGRWYQVRIEVEGSQLRVFVDNQFLLSATDTALEQGYVELGLGANAIGRFDNIKVWSLNAAG